MIKRMTLLARRANITPHQFREHWAGQHAGFGRSLPGVVKYTQNRVTTVLWQHFHDEPFSVDGIVEIFFENEAAMENAARSDMGTRVIPQDEPLFLRGLTLCVVETEGRHDNDGTKVIVAMSKKHDADDRSDRSILNLAKEAGATSVSVNRVSRTYARSGMWTEPMPPEWLLVVWFPSADAARSAFGIEGRLASQIAAASMKASAYLCDPLVIV